MKSPNWLEEELILAVNFYLEHGRKWINSCSDKSPDIIAFSNLLKSMALFSKEQKGISNFRSPDSVHMKLMNFKGIDQDNTAEGLRNSSILDRKVWNDYVNNPELLRAKVASILSEFSPSAAVSIELPSGSMQDNHYSTTLSNARRLLETLSEQFRLVREKAVSIESIDESQKIMNLMYDYISQLAVWHNAIDELIGPILKEVEVMQDQDQNPMAISQKAERHTKSRKQKKNSTKNAPVQMKIGQYVLRSFKIIAEESLLSAEDISNLSNAEWCRDNLHLGFAFLKAIDRSKPIAGQAYEGNYQRYWMQPHMYGTAGYLLCKEWFEQNRKYYDAWISKFGVQQSSQHATIEQSTDDVTSQVPSTIGIAGIECSANSWKEVLIQVCNYVISLKSFDDNILLNNDELKGRTRNYFNKDGKGMTRSAVHLKEGLWVETNLSAKHIVSLCHKILIQFGFSYDDFEYKCYPRGSISKHTKTNVVSGVIKFSPKYSSVSLNADLLKSILLKIKEIDARDVCIKISVLIDEIAPQVLTESTYQHPSHPLRYIINFLKDIGVVIPYQDAKVGKYIIEDYEVIQELIDNPFLIQGLMQNKE